MKLQEIFDHLTYGELSQLSLGGGDIGSIHADKYKNVVSHINLGLTALFKRFTLKENNLLIQLIPDRFTYPLKSDFAEYKRGSREPDRFIQDSFEEKFLDDIIKVSRVYTSAGYEMALNDLEDKYAVFTPSLYTIRVPSDVVLKADGLPDALKTDTLEVFYQATHPKIDAAADGFDPVNVEVELPGAYLDALLYYVGSRLHNPIGMGNNEFHMGNSYAAKYEKECELLEFKNIKVDQGSQSDRLHRNGWV